MFSNLSDKAKIALFTAVGMICFLFAGALVYSFSTSLNINRGTTSNTNDSSSSIKELYQNLTEADSTNLVSMVKEVNQTEIPNGQVIIDDRWVLYVTGSVKTPGIYRLPEDARVYELVEAAGGFTATADVVAVNMAARLHDGDHLHVPLMGENNRNQLGSGTVAFTQDRRDNAGTNSQGSSKGPLRKSIDLNRASAQELQMLPGVGPAMSERIIQYRNQNGGFKQVSDLINVSGIGAKKLESIEQFIFVR
jgi:competence protein ComEA